MAGLCGGRDGTAREVGHTRGNSGKYRVQARDSHTPRNGKIPREKVVQREPVSCKMLDRRRRGSQ